MNGEIDKDFYCSAGLYRDGDCAECLCGCQTCKNDCENHHRKWPTPKQFRKDYGDEYPDDGAVWVLTNINKKKKWFLTDYEHALCALDGPTVCACTPFGKPGRDWRPA